MAEYKRRTSMTPFLALRSGEFWLARCNGVEVIKVKGVDTPVISLDVYFTGNLKDTGGLPPAETMMPHLKNEPSPVLTGQNKALMDALFPESEQDKGTGKVFLIAYYGQKPLPGGHKFNQWDVLELVQ